MCVHIGKEKSNNHALIARQYLFIQIALWFGQFRITVLLLIVLQLNEQKVTKLFVYTPLNALWGTQLQMTF